ncbi:MAG: hypothetical protein IID60_06325 [Proteobacteria bacterium]|nr:hypothetical protein [Pseudomonadota bacterium]
MQPPPGNRALNLYAITIGNGLAVIDSLKLTIGYKSTLNNNAASDDLRMSIFNLSLTTGWHRLLEGANRLSGG